MAGQHRREDTTGKAFAGPVLWIIVLLAGYWLIADWESVPRFISTTLGGLG